MGRQDDPVDGFWLRYLGFIWLTTVATGVATLVCYLIWNVATILHTDADRLYFSDRLGSMFFLLAALVFVSFLLAPFFVAVASPVWFFLYRSASRSGTVAAATLIGSAVVAAGLCALALIVLFGDRLFSHFLVRADMGGLMNLLLPYLPAALSLFIAPLIALRLYDHD